MLPATVPTPSGASLQMEQNHRNGNTTPMRVYDEGSYEFDVLYNRVQQAIDELEKVRELLNDMMGMSDGGLRPRR